ncbi:unnamed protein product [Macrosiphum euphorbiae]|uniref:Uncharacterized protein n=1 Tax=Macrosiphum euphorbiae TaxID=13131 RepID=A0AAV0XI21_9HEMI|nr:unnamed protein product [Macrosiphum euphorbiae]
MLSLCKENPIIALGCSTAQLLRSTARLLRSTALLNCSVQLLNCSAQRLRSTAQLLRSRLPAPTSFRTDRTSYSKLAGTCKGEYVRSV